MKNFKLCTLFFVLVAFITSSQAKDFELKKLPKAKEAYFDMNVGDPMSYYDYVHQIIGQALLELADTPTRIKGDNEKVLHAGGGVRVKLGEKNYNVHINYPKGPQGGRSYGWTASESGLSGRVGDWSDRLFLEEVIKVTTSGNDNEIANFYRIIINILGKSDPSGIDDVSWQSQRVIGNFLAIYTAEQYRSMVPDPHHNWDDALFQTALLAAFHGGQSEFKMFYTGQFTTATKKQAPGVYNRGKPGVNADKAPAKPAAMFDYWQFSANPDSKRSGINITRNDFTKMGKMITSYLKANNSTRLKKIEVVVGKTNNVIEAISKHFTLNRSSMDGMDQFSKLVSSFMLEIRDDADAITTYTEQAVESGDCEDLFRRRRAS